MTVIPAQITFRGLDVSDALEAAVRERVDWIGRFYGRIIRCHVLIEVPHRHHRSVRHFHVRIDFAVAGGDTIVVSHQASMHGRQRGEANDAHAALHEAFDVARRRLEDYVTARRDVLAPFVDDAAIAVVEAHAPRRC